MDVAIGILDAEEGVRVKRWLEWKFTRKAFVEQAEERTDTLAIAISKAMRQYRA